MPLIELIRGLRGGSRSVAVLALGTGLAAITFGVIGLLRLDGYDDSVLNVAFGVVALFIGGGGYHTTPSVPLTLAAAQVLALLTTTSAVLLFFHSLARNWTRRRQARRYSEHTIVVGSGRSGGLLLNALKAEAHVVVIDVDPSARVKALCDAQAWPLIAADVLVDDVVDSASVADARRIYIGTGSDTRDLAIARRLADAASSDASILTRIHVRLDSTGVARSLISNDHVLRSSNGHTIEYMSRFDFAAMAIQQRILVELAARRSTTIDSRLAETAAFVGSGKHVAALADLVARSNTARRQLQLDALAENVIELRPDDVGRLGPTDVIVLELGTETETLELAVSLAGQHQLEAIVAIVDGGDQPIWLTIGEGTPVYLVDPSALLDSPEILDQGPVELMAQLIHADYFAKVQARGQLVQDKPAHHPWSELTDEIRQRNRQQARRFYASLDRLHQQLLPVGQGRPIGSPSLELIELEAEREHEDWLEDHSGWVYGEREDRDLKQHPHLVPWSQLDEETREYDRDAVRRRPALAALLGLHIVGANGQSGREIVA